MAIGGLPFSILRSQNFNLFTPIASGLTAWYSALDFSSIAQSGGIVSAWNNRVSANHLTQAPAFRPSYASSALNSRPGILFSSNLSQTQSLGAAVISVSAFTLHALYVPSSGTANQPVVYNGNSGSNGFGILDRQTGNVFGMLFGGVAFAASSIAHQLNQPALFTAVRASNGLTTIQVNSVQGFSGTRSLNTPSGALSVGSSAFSGTVHEILLYDRALTSLEVNQNESAIRAAYGL